MLYATTGLDALQYPPPAWPHVRLAVTELGPSLARGNVPFWESIAWRVAMQTLQKEASVWRALVS